MVRRALLTLGLVAGLAIPSMASIINGNDNNYSDLQRPTVPSSDSSRFDDSHSDHTSDSSDSQHDTTYSTPDSGSIKLHDGENEQGSFSMEGTITTPDSVRSLCQGGESTSTPQTTCGGSGGGGTEGHPSSVVPEPASLALISIGAGMILFRRRRRESSESLPA